VDGFVKRWRLRVRALERAQVVLLARQSGLALHQFAQHRLAGDDCLVESAVQQCSISVRVSASIEVQGAVVLSSGRHDAICGKVR
jgi:hypothetical protein